MIYITGSEGFIGSRLQQKLKQPYVCIDKKLGLDILKMDWNMFVRRYGAPKTIIHLAANTNPRESMESIEEYYVNNCVATRKIFAQFPRARILYLSTSLVEHDIRNFYSLTKYLNEIDAKNHPNALGIRATTVYGDGARENMIVPRIINGDCEYVCTYTRDFIWIDDLVDLIISLTTKDNTGIMSVSSGDVHNIDELAFCHGVTAEVFNPKDEPETNVINNEGLTPTMTVNEYIRNQLNAPV